MATRAAAAALAAALVACAFVAKSGTGVQSTALVLAAATLLAGAACAWSVLEGRGAGAAYSLLAMLGALALVTALSLFWSANPDASLIAAGRALAYLAVAAGAACLARRWPHRAHVLLEALLIGGFVICAYGLAARIWPASLGKDELGAIANRLGQPFGYWNALGGAAAMTALLALWQATRQTASESGRALAVPALGVALLTLVLTQSRGALAAFGAGLAIWLLAVPRRAVSVAPLLVAALAATPVAAWALSQPAFTVRAASLGAREAAAGDFGLMCLALVLVLTVVGALWVRLSPGWTLPIGVRRRLERVTTVGALALCALALLAIALNAETVTTKLERRIDDLVSERAPQPTEGAGRLVATASTRSAYWREALDLFSERPLTGWGADAFEITRLRHRHGPLGARHAHGYLAQQAADLGVLGVAFSLLALVAFLPAAARTLGVGRRRTLSALPWDDQRCALAAAVVVSLAFGVQSFLDWTWYVPALALPALGCAAFVSALGRGHAERPARRPLAPAARRALAALTVVAALAAAWTIVQPALAARETERSLQALAHGRAGAALDHAENAQRIDPLALDPLLAAARAEVALGRPAAARNKLAMAVSRHPQDPRAWLAAARHELVVELRPDRALELVKGALWLDPESRSGRELFLTARARLHLLCVLRARYAAMRSGSPPAPRESYAVTGCPQVSRRGKAR